MAEVLLSIGSNINREHNIRGCIHELERLFGDVHISPWYESEAVGFDGAPFINLAVAIQTEQSVGDLALSLRDIENRFGRDRSSPKFSSRTLDIDILTYDDCVGVVDGVELPRAELLEHAFVLLPVSRLRPNSLCPGTTQCYAALWQQFEKTSQKLWELASCE